MSTKCIIIEDEPLAIERLKMYIDKVPSLELCGAFTNPVEAVPLLQSEHVDLIFLDINMDEMTGIELLQNFQVKPAVVITTAYDQYALQGYDLNVTDYLLKPFTFERFLQAIAKISKAPATEDNGDDFVFIKTENRLERIALQEVLFVEGMRDYRRIHTQSKKIMTLQTFTELEALLPADQICRVHKSYMVAINHIESVERNRIFIGKEIIPVSETYRKAFFSRIQPSKT